MEAEANGSRSCGAKWSSARNVARGAALALALTTTMGVVNEVAAQDRVVVDVDVRAEHRDRPRLRFGVSGVGGGFVGAIHGGLGGIAPRIGVQFTDMIAVYLQGHGLIGGFAPDPGDATVVGFAFHEAMFEVTFADMFQLGAGPSLDFVWGCTGDNGGASCGRGGPFVGGDFRAAFVLGNRGPGRRAGVSFSVDVHPTWVDRDFATVLLFGVGFELY